MARQERVVFGPFEVDPAAGDLLKRGVRVRLSGQPFRILTFLLTRPGQAVSQEELKKEIWGDGTFVDFEHSLHAAINKLRRALGDSAEHPRYIETVPGRGYRFIGGLEPTFPPQVAVKAASVAETKQPSTEPSSLASRRFWWIAGAVCAIGAAFILIVAGRLWSPRPTPAPWQFTKLTSEEGNAGSPALSRDGKLLAYSFEKEGAQDIYIKQIARGQPIRLTFDGAGNTTPDFSPDASRIVFRSDRAGGGIYDIPSLGGEARLLARDGLNPKYSPDGTQVAFWIGDPGVAAAVPGNGTAWMVPSEGGQPRRIGSGFTTARSPCWSPDGRHLLIVGYRSAKAFDMSSLDWWILSTERDDAVETGFRDALRTAGLKPPSMVGTPLIGQQEAIVLPEACWLAGNRVVFSARSGDAHNLWEAGISPEGKVNGHFQRLTAGSGNEVCASCASPDTVAFARVESSASLWALPFDLNRGKPTGPPELIVRQPPALREGPSISGDGKRIAFGSYQSGTLNIWLRDIAAEKEVQVASSFVQRYPLISPSGDHVAFSSYENDKRILYVSAAGGVPEKLCEGCLRATDWSSDEKTLLTFGGSPYQVNLLDLASHQQTPLVVHPAYSVLYARFSPDHRWISFTVRVTPNRSQIMIAPLDGPRPVPESSWIKITEEQSPEDSSLWAPDGQTLYFTSGRDGHVCLWGQRVDLNSRRPSDQPFALQHFHERPLEKLRIWSATRNRIAVALMENSGVIWMMSHADGR